MSRLAVDWADLSYLPLIDLWVFYVLVPSQAHNQNWASGDLEF